MTRLRTRRIGLLFAALAALAAVGVRARGAPQADAPVQGPPQAVFTAGVSLVHVEVSVLDKNRLPVEGLTARDFTVLEEGRERPVVAFTPVTLEPRVRPPAPWMADAPADVNSNDFGTAGRLVILMLDRSLEPADGPEAIRIAEAAVDQLRPGDLAAVAWSNFGVPQNFTADRSRLLDAIHQPTSNPVSDSAQELACVCGRCSMDMLANIAESVQDVRQRRKVLIFIGRRLPSGAGATCGSVVEGARKRFVRAAEVGNLTMYVVDPRGLETLSPSASAGRPGQSRGAANLRRISALLEMTDPTGGRLVARNDASRAMPEVFRESSAYYVLGFEPAYTDADGRFRRISVKVNRRDVTIQARRGYYAPGRPAPRLGRAPEGLPADLASAISGLWPKTDIPLTIAASPIAVPGVAGGAAAVLVGVRQDLSPNGPLGDASLALPDRPAGGTPVSILVGAFDSNGESHGYERQTITVTPRPAGDRVFEYEVAARLDLKPGRYEIRAAIEDGTLHETASAYTYITMPDFIRDPASLSGLFLEAAPGTGAVLTQQLTGLLPSPPTTRRTFARTDRVRAYAEAYQSVTHLVIPGYVTTEIFNTRDERVYRQEQRILPEGNRRTHELSIDVPVDRLEPGEYLLRVELRYSSATAIREARFEVR
jgi:VWFA-related protein